MAAEPLSAKKQRLRPGGARRTSSSARFTAGGCVKPAKMACSRWSNCSRTAALMRGFAVPEEIDPPGADAVEVALAGEVLEPHARACAQRDHRHGLVVLHLRARMPHVREIARHPVGIAGAHGAFGACHFVGGYCGTLLWQDGREESAMRVDVATGLMVGVKQVLSPFFDERPAGRRAGSHRAAWNQPAAGRVRRAVDRAAVHRKPAGRGASGIPRARGPARVGAPADPP